MAAWDDRWATRRQATEDLREVARLMGEHSRAALLVAEVQLSRIKDAIGPRLPPQVGGKADHDMLLRLSSEQRFVDSVWVFDADANMRATSFTLPAGGFNVRDRAYYTALRDGQHLFISPLIWGRVRDQAFVVVSRRLDDANGNFAGGIEVTLTGAYFTDFYRDLDPTPGAVFAIHKEDGSMVIRSALPPRQETFPKPLQLLAAAEHAAEGTFVQASEVDGVERLTAFRRLEGAPLIVSVGLPLQEVFADWHRRTRRNGAVAAGGLLAFWLVAAGLAMTMRREENLRVRAERLLAEKQVLFQEIHHRVKNNLQIIASFLTMQAVHSRDPATAAAFEEALSRLQSMSLVHQTLYEQNEASEVSMDAYLRALGHHVGQTYGTEERGIRIEVRSTETRLPMDQAVPLALLANEALTNALKHAFPGGRGGHVRLELDRAESGLRFSLSDDGIGMPADAKGGLGMTILTALACQLGTELIWSTGPGTRLTVTVPA